MELLNLREERDHFEKELLEKYHGTLLTLRANFPGMDKRHEKADHAVEILLEEARGRFRPVHEERLNNAEGLQYFILLKESPAEVKQATLSLEENHPLGRLIDMDVRDEEKIWSRRDFSLPGRKCYLCDDLAVHCVRSQKHSREEVVSYFISKVDAYMKSGITQNHEK
ncbi:citrate lyase holo-[acyl-carrier protein] synthase [Proteiniclasticum sp. SCR006]|uniref:citrate lyase holo-[acyl-carrier protein] synthase n=1 Tax=Proteiniclasticum aestuarii TaxID=2817862 RepID=A0A939H6Q8_9CLOT|nr:citrate lyase holo-[acyl-carrier protein] synthase [Proteiniclasticum aestuarii]MBO1265209.1 citrate lyase holo-[acyl-carrier protein] synthase [Proteiniclasticum aestuarii]